MPDNFIPLQTKLKATAKDPTPVLDRFRHLQALDKRSDLRRRGQELGGINQKQFEERLTKLRLATVKWGSARIEGIFVASINKKFPELEVDGRDVESSADFVEVIKKGPWDKTLMKYVAYASFGMWGGNNQFAINLEVEFTKMLRIEFTGLLANGRPAVKIHKGKCISQLFVKCKGSMVGKFRSTCKRRWRECVYS